MSGCVRLNTGPGLGRTRPWLEAHASCQSKSIKEAGTCIRVASAPYGRLHHSLDFRRGASHAQLGSLPSTFERERWAAGHVAHGTDMDSHGQTMDMDRGTVLNLTTSNTAVCGSPLPGSSESFVLPAICPGYPSMVAVKH